MKTTHNYWAACAAPVLALLLGACVAQAPASSQPDSEASVSSPAPSELATVLPDPASLPTRTAAGAGDADRVRTGAEFLSELPHNHVGLSGSFSPQPAPGQPPFSAAAYAVYRFDHMFDYSGSHLLRSFWKGAVPQQTYVALPNVMARRWDWYSLDAAGALNLPALFAHCDASGNLNVALFVLDSGSFSLDYLLAGDGVAPRVAMSTNLSADPLANVGPFDVAFEAGASRGFGAAIVDYAFDLNMDGTFDVEHDADGALNHLYQPGKRGCIVRATDSLGRSAEQRLEFLLIDPANQPPSAAFSADQPLGSGPRNVQLNAGASSDPDGSIVSYAWDFENDGIYDVEGPSPDIEHNFAEAGDTTVRLLVTDDNLSSATTTRTISCSQGWHSSVVEDQAETRTQIAICSSGADSHICVAYNDQNSGELHFLASGNPEGTSWPAVWRPVPGTHAGYAPSLVSTVSTDWPLLAYGAGDVARSLYVTAAGNAQGSSWSAPVLVDDGHKIGESATLALVNTIPVVAAASHPDEPGNSQLLYFVAKDLNGGAWNAPSVALDSAALTVYGRPAVGYGASGIFHKPILACGISYQQLHNRLAVVRADDINGAAWSAATIFSGFMQTGSFGLCGGRPSFACGPGSSTGNSGFDRAADADGNFDFPPGYVSEGPGEAVLLVVNDKPVVIFYKSSDDKIYYYGSQNPEGTLWFAPFVIAHGVGGEGAQLNACLIGDQPVVAYNYYDGVSQHQIRCLSYF